MSIQTELTRLTNAKAAIQTAIEGKGVTVPSGTLLDGMAALIESIQAGEVAFPPYKSIYAGTITPANNMSYGDFADAIAGNSLSIFNIYCVTCQDKKQVTDKFSIYSVCQGGDLKHVGRVISYDGSNHTFSSTAPYAWKVGTSATYVLQAGVTYYYVCGVI